MKTLVAEDDGDTRELLTSLLTFAGHEVVQTSNGLDAWREFESGTYPLVVCDWLMPELNGLELCSRIRGAGHSHYTYIIMLTVLSGKAHFLQAMAAGADDFISKPFDPDEFQARLSVARRIVSLQSSLKTLEGVLSTCMYCRKIRDENQVWVTIEQYISERTNAAFSHGVCPDCYSKAASQIDM
jgi:DNA-binding response OmpR family regulator